VANAPIHDLHVTVSPDRMRAFVHGVLQAPTPKDAAERLVRTALARAAVVHGIREDAIAKAAGRLSLGEPIADFCVAVGQDPKGAVPPGITLSEPSYREEELPQGISAQSTSAVPYCEAISRLAKPSFVKEGDAVGAWEEGLAGIDGTTVTGETVPASVVSAHQRMTRLGRGLKQRKGSQEISATAQTHRLRKKLSVDRCR
jgi:uncharacterized protein (DUF342 family)